MSKMQASMPFSAKFFATDLHCSAAVEDHRKKA
jgi:hypothetical protein